MDVEIKNLEKQKELDILEQENELIKAELEKEKYSRIKLAVLVGALVLLSFSLLAYSRSLKKSNARLEKEIRIRKSSESELQELKTGLEQQVVDRTAQLQQINEDLHDKIIEKTQSQNVLLETEKMAGIGQMAAGIAHEIRNPIAIIRSTAQFLSGAYISTQDSMKILTETSDDINKVITRLMNFTKLKPLRKEVIDLNDFFREISTKFEHQLHESGIKMVLELHQELPVVEMDPGLMTNMISELITNSIEALSRGGLINVSALKRNGQIEISIEDDGNGIKDIEQAIRSFYSTKKKHPGLGFNYVRYIAGLHDFTFNLESTLNKGTRARIII